MKSVVIIGAGESGVGAAILAKRKGMDVFVSEADTIASRYKQELIEYSIPYEEGGHDFEKVLVTEVVIKSPGVPEHAPILRMLKERGRKVISEIEFGHLFYSGLTIAITGSNGKTTASGLLYHILHSAHREVELGGNYGKSFARIVADSSPSIMVLEVSSFQLDNIDTFKPKIAILLNISPDHLDRYEYKMENYVEAKFRINMNQTQKDYFIFNGDDEEILNRMASQKSNGTIRPITKSMYTTGIASKEDDSVFEMSLKGQHNLFNAAAVVEACRIVGLTEVEIAHGLKTFVNLPHRLESCGVINGVEFVNDSKATNVDSVYYALDAMTKPVIWIAGGTDKGNDYTQIENLVKDKVKTLICLGLDNEKLKSKFKNDVHSLLETTKVSVAVEEGLRCARSGDVVLLSPACASFDLFKNYMDRGNQFKEAVAHLKQSLENTNKEH